MLICSSGLSVASRSRLSAHPSPPCECCSPEGEPPTAPRASMARRLLSKARRQMRFPILNASQSTLWSSQRGPFKDWQRVAASVPHLVDELVDESRFVEPIGALAGEGETGTIGIASCSKERTSSACKTKLSHS